MILRQWQANCIERACRQYQRAQSHFLCMATPGAGKTTMAALLAKRLLDSDLADLVICFAPSVLVVDDFRDELERQTGQRMDGLIGSRGCAMTYQSMLSLPDSFWALLSTHRVFAIFDEIHHCAGFTVEMANAWGERILTEIQGRATYTLALTGTPWRSDQTPIVLSRYCAENRSIDCDYVYGLHEAIQDRVCRTPNLILIDNDNITVNEGTDSTRYRCIKDLLDQSRCTYQQLLENEYFARYVLQQAHKKLEELRRTVPDAGGLIVAASVAHAHQLAQLVKVTLHEDALIATYYEDDATQIIRQFKTGMQKWIISVGMISEGTNIPRLRVCCHLTRVKTEMYFRQVLGRILRSNGNEGETAYLYMPAEPTLLQYAQRLAEDIPAMDVLKFEQMTTKNTPENMPPKISAIRDSTGINLKVGTTNSNLQSPAPVVPNNFQFAASSPLAQSYESTVDVFGKFKQKLIALGVVHNDIRVIPVR